MGFLKKLFGFGPPAPNLPVHPDDENLVTEYDRKWWELLSLDDCKTFEEQDNAAQFSLFLKHKEDGLSDEEAAKRVRKAHVFYYGTLKQRDDDPLCVSKDDAKLPYILKDRVNKALMKYVIKMDKKYIEAASSMNAIVRNLLKEEKI